MLGDTLLTPSRIVGYRMWTTRPGQIVGLHGRPWREPRMSAECHLGMARGGAPHVWPEGICGGRCGINAYLSPAALVAAARRAPMRRRLAPSSPEVGLPMPEGYYGAVALTGRVIEHERGYRAEFAEIIRLVFVHGLTVSVTSNADAISSVFPDPGARRPAWEAVARPESPMAVSEILEELVAI